MRRLRCNLTFMDSLLFLIGWSILTFITCGLAAPFFVFSLIKYIINRSSLVEDGRERSLNCRMSLGSDFMFLLGWTLLTIVTVGLASPFFAFSLIKYAINSTEIEG